MVVAFAMVAGYLSVSLVDDCLLAFQSLRHLGMVSIWHVSLSGEELLILQPRKLTRL